jgi:hypothetical protein
MACSLTTRTTAVGSGVDKDTEKQARCAAWRKIRYQYPGDTLPTIEQVRTHNAAGKRLGCW